MSTENPRPSDRLGALFTSAPAQLFAVLAAAIAINAYTFVDPDLGWLLDAGARILAGDGIPRFNDRTFIEPGHAIVLHGWATDTFCAAAQRALGGAGLCLARLALVAGNAAALWWAIGRATENVIVRVALAVGGMAVMPAFFFPLRAQLTSSIELALLVGLCLDGRRGALWCLVPLCAAWPNLHGAFPAGVVLVGAFCAGTLVERFLAARAQNANETRDQRDVDERVPVVDLCALPIACALATLCTPYGFGMWSMIVDTLSGGFGDVLPEWFPGYSPFIIRALWPSMIFVWPATIAAFVLLPRGDVRIRLLLVVTALLMLQASRNLRLAPFIVAPILAAALAHRLRGRLPSPRASAFVVGALAVVGVVVCALHGEALVTLRPVAMGMANAARPIVFLGENHLTGKIWTPLESGGAVLWSCRACSVSVDGRAQVAYTPQWTLTALKMQPRADKQLLVKNGVDYAIVGAYQEVLDALAPDYFPLFCDGEQCVVSGKAADRNRSYVFPPPLPDSILFDKPGRPTF